MKGKLAHQVTEEGVTVVLRPRIGAPASLRVPIEEARRFAWSLLADVDPEGVAGGAPDRITVGRVLVDRAAKRVSVDDNRIEVSPREFAIMEALALGRDRVVTRQEIMEHVYGGMAEPDPEIIGAYVLRIRNKLRRHRAAGHIETVFGVGFRLVGNPAPDTAWPAAPPASPVHRAILARLGAGPARFGQLWRPADATRESTVRSALKTMVDRGTVLKTGPQNSPTYSLPAPSQEAQP